MFVHLFKDVRAVERVKETQRYLQHWEHFCNFFWEVNGPSAEVRYTKWFIVLAIRNTRVSQVLREPALRNCCTFRALFIQSIESVTKDRSRSFPQLRPAFPVYYLRVLERKRKDTIFLFPGALRISLFSISATAGCRGFGLQTGKLERTSHAEIKTLIEDQQCTTKAPSRCLSLEKSS